MGIEKRGIELYVIDGHIHVHMYLRIFIMCQKRFVLDLILIMAIPQYIFICINCAILSALLHCRSRLTGILTVVRESRQSQNILIKIILAQVSMVNTMYVMLLKYS